MELEKIKQHPKCYFSTNNGDLFHGDCLEVMKELDVKADLCLTDIPYGTTANKWDVVIPFEPMWEQLKQLIKGNGAIVLFGSQPFTSALIMSNLKMFQYNWIYRKTKSTGFLNAKKRPLNDCEDVCVFYRSQPIYNPQMIIARKLYKRGFVKRKKSDCYGDEKDFKQAESGERYPKRVIDIGNANTSDILHPTQKPVALMEYLIKTYTNEGETVLDFTIGSGTTAVACENLNRRWIGIEQDESYCEIAAKRINKASKQFQLFEGQK